MYGASEIHQISVRRRDLLERRVVGLLTLVLVVPCIAKFFTGAAVAVGADVGSSEL